jgi:hypothetical protein
MLKDSALHNLTLEPDFAGRVSHYSPDELDKSGHFTAFEQPALFTQERRDCSAACVVTNQRAM